MTRTTAESVHSSMTRKLRAWRGPGERLESPPAHAALLKGGGATRLFDRVESKHSFEAPEGATPPGPAPAPDEAPASAAGAAGAVHAAGGVRGGDERAPLPDEPPRAMLPPRWPDAAPRPPAFAPEGVVREPLRPGWHEWLRAGLRTAAVATAATAGVLVHFGLATGEGAFGAFTQVGRLAAGVARADGAVAHGGATVVGLIIHALVVTGWSLLYSRVVTGWSTVARWVAAVVVAALAWAAGQLLLPSMLRLGHGVRAFVPQVLLLHVVLALALALGMRLALEADDEM